MKLYIYLVLEISVDKFTHKAAVWILGGVKCFQSLKLDPNFWKLVFDARL